MSRHRNSGTNRNARHNQHNDFSVALPAGTAEDLYLMCQKESAPIFLFLDGVQDPHNLGACLRTAEGAGIDAIVIPQKGSVKVTNTVIEISCGAAAHIPVISIQNFRQVLTRLKKLGCTIIGTSDQATQTLYQTDLRKPLCLIVGNEATGVRKMTLDRCDHIVKIPMIGKVPCLNVSVSTGICLYEIVRQRHHALSHPYPTQAS